MAARRTVGSAPEELGSSTGAATGGSRAGVAEMEPELSEMFDGAELVKLASVGQVRAGIWCAAHHPATHAHAPPLHLLAGPRHRGALRA